MKLKNKPIRGVHPTSTPILKMMTFANKTDNSGQKSDHNKHKSSGSMQKYKN